jgi:hypothetical protein
MSLAHPRFAAASTQVTGRSGKAGRAAGLRALAGGLLTTLALTTSSGCVIAHSRQAMSPNLDEAPPANARFVQEEDSGLLIGGFIQVSDADHFAVLLARLRERNRCKHLSSAQLDYYTDHWVVVAFPVARVTALCEPQEAGPDRVTP